MFYQLKLAEPADKSRLIEFVEAAGSNAAGIEEKIDQFVMMTDSDKRIAACIGLEIFGEYGLLRTLVVSDKLDQAYILSLFQSIHEVGRIKKLKNYYLVAGGQGSTEFLEVIGFKQTSKAELPEEMLGSKHIQSSLKADGSVIMVKNT
ncbi:hypothetical protein [Metabacillus sp. FJAT-52054]|uniref:Uncharacterized protein n=1 Tax=Metabacillus sediminis TaxID=3117746 RepID=A0ABZ2NHT0_9BACI